MIFIVALGGAIGTVVRWGLLQLTPQASGIPWMTLGINVAGSLLLGYLARTFSTWDPPASPSLVMGLTVGLCGGFTTFSTFAGETWKLLERGDWIRAGGYAVMSVTLSVAAIAAGIALSKALHRA